MAAPKIRLSHEDQFRLSQLMSELTDKAKHSISLHSLIEQWRTLVIAAKHGYDGSIYEYDNDLSVRDLLARVEQALSQEGREALRSVLAPLDENFAATTLQLESPLRGLEGDAKEWWHYRIPVKLGEELRGDLQDGG